MNPLERIERAILLIHGEKAMLDGDLADRYGADIWQSRARVAFARPVPGRNSATRGWRRAGRQLLSKMDIARAEISWPNPGRV